MRKMTPAVVLALLALLFAWTASPQMETVPPQPVETPPMKTPRLTFTSRVDRHRGFAVRYPSSWSLDRFQGRCLELASPDGLRLQLTEGRSSSGALVAREHGRRLYASVTSAPETAEASRSAAAEVIKSLRLRASGRCNLPQEPIRWRRSRALGTPGWGRLVNGVKLPGEGQHYFTWDPVRRASPNRAGRRWGTDGLLRTTLGVVNLYAAAHPLAPRVGVGDLSRPRGGDFGPKHETHTNGLDVDVYYPRKDRLERPPRQASQVDRRLAQALVDLFVAAGASRIYVGPNVGLTGPRGIIRVIPNHDNHLHARIPHWRA